MSTIINTPGNSEGSGGNVIGGVIIAIVVLALAVLFFMYGLPMMRNNSNQDNGGVNINVQLPDNSNPGGGNTSGGNAPAY